MGDFLWDEKSFSALSEYIRFLSDLPDTLVEIEHFSSVFRRSGHVLLPPPDAQALTRAATDNEGRWRAIVGLVPSLGFVGHRVAEQTATFVREFEQVAQDARQPALLGGVDPSRFTPVNFGGRGSNCTWDLMQLIDNLCRWLDQCAELVARLKTWVAAVSQTVHGLFARFIELLTLRLCTCHGPDPRIEIYYVLGRIILPSMHYDPGRHYSEAQRKALARAHLQALRGLYVRSTSAGNNIADLCHRMGYFLTQVKRELQTNDRHQRLRRARTSFSQLAYPLAQLNEMAHALGSTSLRLEP
ncbi:MULTISPECIES: hypothetical protein [Pseudomonas]|uniref:hypothetical protein n=1 Tax=Pseudomonas TaxID=286 RepID=UPI001BEA63A8|nr:MULTISPECIES: hypothetical protein [Pseudomonas]MBT2338676.1 hypothetical protein [Pseudomonas fluorescens]MCD4531854.1 hypothetical protein [Pseudomonas sp. C3-2018]